MNRVYMILVHARTVCKSLFVRLMLCTVHMLVISILNLSFEFTPFICTLSHSPATAHPEPDGRRTRKKQRQSGKPNFLSVSRSFEHIYKRWFNPLFYDVFILITCFKVILFLICTNMEHPFDLQLEEKLKPEQIQKTLQVRLEGSFVAHISLLIFPCQKLYLVSNAIIAVSLSRYFVQSKLDGVDRQFESRERHAWWRKEILMYRAKQEAMLRREEVLR